MRQPLGIAIIGGLLISQVLTLYTTPVVYIHMERFRLWGMGIVGRSRQAQSIPEAESNRDELSA